MIPKDSQKPVFRFAPSPNGRLHLGHAYSALLNHDMAVAAGGRFLLRIEDIDTARCTPDHEKAIFEDLTWLGLLWETPVRRQSDHLPLYRASLDRLVERGLAYPAFMTRGEVKAHVAAFEEAGTTWPRDPDSAPHYPPLDRELSRRETAARIAGGAKHAWRLDMAKALEAAGTHLHWMETGMPAPGTVEAEPDRWGDVVLWRSDAPSSYHLSVVVDDAAQGVTHVVRGLDLYHATGVHRLLQHLLGFDAPVYHHHRLILTEDGRKLSKSRGDTGLAELRAAGVSAASVRGMIGL